MPYKDKEKQKAYLKRANEKRKEYKTNWMRQKRKRKPESSFERKVRGLREYYGLTLEQYINIMRVQDYRCLLCQVSFTEMDSKHIHVDHCHKTGQVRGVLCSHCNHALGRVKDDPTTVYRMFVYLKEYS